MRKKIPVLALVLLVFLSSCVTMNEFPIEVFQPAKVTLPPSVKNITLVNRNLKYSSDTLDGHYSKDFKLVKDITPANIDSLSVKACFDSLTLKMQALSRFSQIKVLPVSSLQKQYVKNINPPSKNLVEKIAADTEADALIFLDMYSSFYSVYPNADNDRSIAKVVTASIWTIYDPSKFRILHHTSLVDTFYWDGLDEQNNYKASRIPNKKAAMQIAAGLAGVKYSKNIVPGWAKVYRKTLSFNQKDFKTAAQLAKKNQWEEASALWEKYLESTKKRARIQALFNLAVASEMNGEIDRASELISKASQVSSSASFGTENSAIRKYSAVLAKRKIELSKINSINYEL